MTGIAMVIVGITAVRLFSKAHQEYIGLKIQA